MPRIKIHALPGVSISNRPTRAAKQRAEKKIQHFYANQKVVSGLHMLPQQAIDDLVNGMPLADVISMHSTKNRSIMQSAEKVLAKRQLNIKDLAFCQHKSEGRLKEIALEKAIGP